MLYNNLRIKNLIVLSLTICIIGLSPGCSKNDCCVDTDITASTMTIAELGCNNAISNMILNAGKQYSIITNQTDYDNTVKGTCHPDIDFSKQQLIIGCFYSQREVQSFNYKYYKSCESNFYKLSVAPEYSSNKVNNETAVYFYQVLVPSNETIEFFKVLFIDKN